nr:MAG TPA: hypothetical protein [Caudoviricetes sp.]
MAFTSFPLSMVIYYHSYDILSILFFNFFKIFFKVLKLLYLLRLPDILFNCQCALLYRILFV